LEAIARAASRLKLTEHIYYRQADFMWSYPRKKHRKKYRKIKYKTSKRELLAAGKLKILTKNG
jgi:hypothetical protein